MGHHSINIAVLLLSLTVGAFLLAKTKKEDLGIFYKVLSWFVIVFSLLLICCSVIRGIVGRERRMNNQNEMMFRGHRGMMMGGGMDMMRGEEMEHENFYGKHHHRGEGSEHEEMIEKKDTLVKH